MDKKRAGVIKLLILAVVLVAAIITGFLTGAIQPDALASSWAFSADVLLRLVIMMAGVLFVEYLVELILGYCKPEAHRARSVITIIRSLLKYTLLGPDDHWSKYYGGIGQRRGTDVDRWVQCRESYC